MLLVIVSVKVFLMSTMNRCKIPLTIRVIDDTRGTVIKVDGYYHKSKCMGARYPHLDLPIEHSPKILVDLVYKRGVNMECIDASNDCVILNISILGYALRLCVNKRKIRCGARRIHVMKTGSGNIYIGPVIIE